MIFMKGSPERVDGRAEPGHWASGVFSRAVEAEGHRPVGAHEIGDDVSQRNLHEIETLPCEERVALVD